MAMRGEMGYPSALTAPTWGFYDVSFKGKPFTFQRPYDSYVMENVLFKISYPAEFHAQTAVECAVQLYPQIKDRLADIAKITLTTHESAIRIISKTGPLHNPADRDHCLQYMVAIGLLFGTLTADHYEQKIAADPRIDELRNKMVVIEDTQYSRDYHDPEKRSIANAIQIEFKDCSKTEKVIVEYPIGHRRRRAEGLPVMKQKLENNLKTLFSEQQTEKLLALFSNADQLSNMPVDQFMQLWIP
jgi:2-methylcitrate dehydratase